MEEKQHFSPRELEVLQGVIDGLTHAQIALKLGVSLRTIDHYTEAIRCKMKTQTTAQAAILLVQQWLKDE